MHLLPYVPAEGYFKRVEQKPSQGEWAADSAQRADSLQDQLLSLEA